MKMILACGLLGILSALSVGCGSNKCEEYADKRAEKWASCGLTVNEGDEGDEDAGGELSCSEAQAKDAECLAPCFDLMACECIDPDKITAGECNDQKRKDAEACVEACSAAN